MAWFHDRKINTVLTLERSFARLGRWTSFDFTQDRLYPYVGRGDFHRAIQPSLISHSEPVEISEPQDYAQQQAADVPLFSELRREMPLPIR